MLFRETGKFPTLVVTHFRKHTFKFVSFLFFVYAASFGLPAVAQEKGSTETQFSLFIPFAPAEFMDLFDEGEKEEKDGLVPKYAPLSEKQRSAVSGDQELPKKQAITVPVKRQPAVRKVTSKPLPTRPTLVVATAYSSTVDQTDASPCTTANGFNVCRHNQENVIAANFLPFGTRVRIPDKFGDRVFIVQDRMNRRYATGRIDIWMKSRQSAIQFGIKKVTIEVLGDQVAANL